MYTASPMRTPILRYPVAAHRMNDGKVVGAHTRKGKDEDDHRRSQCYIITIMEGEQRGKGAYRLYSFRLVSVDVLNQ